MILNPDKDTRPCAVNHLYHFQKWLRRPMTRLESSVILPIERLRTANRRPDLPVRVYVDDPGCYGSAIRDILILYIRWISALVTPQFNACIVGRYRNEANQAVRRSFLNQQLKINLELLRNARLTPERLAAYRSAGWLRRLSPNISTASAKFIDHIRGRWFNHMLILDTDRLGHSSRSNGFCRGRTRYQTFSDVINTAGALLPSAHNSITIIHGNPATHPRSLYARLRRQSHRRDSRIFHLITPTTQPSADQTINPSPLRPSGSDGFSRQSDYQQISSAKETTTQPFNPQIPPPPNQPIKKAI